MIDDDDENDNDYGRKIVEQDSIIIFITSSIRYHVLCCPFLFCFYAFFSFWVHIYFNEIEILTHWFLFYFYWTISFFFIRCQINYLLSININKLHEISYNLYIENIISLMVNHFYRFQGICYAWTTNNFIFFSVSDYTAAITYRSVEWLENFFLHFIDFHLTTFPTSLLSLICIFSIFFLFFDNFEVNNH